MSTPEDEATRLAALRRRAELLAAQSGLAGPGEARVPTPEALARAVHELQVHQIELEMQNEELRRAQAELEQSRACYFQLYDLAPVGYCTLGGSGLVLEANQTALQMLGRPLAHVAGRPFSVMIHRDDQGAFHTRYAQFRLDGAQFTCELRLAPPHDPPLWTGLTVKAAEGSSRDGEPMPAAQVWVILTDLSEHRRAEEERADLEARLRRNHRLEAIGRLAGGMAHGFNNLLGAMAGNLDLLRLEAASGPCVARLDALDQLVARAGEQVARIMIFAGRSVAKVQDLDLNRQVEAMAGLLRSSLPARTTLEVDLGAGLPAMSGDPSQIQQVVLNLVLNAAEALGEAGGVITLDTRRVLVTAGELPTCQPGLPLAAGPHLALSVSDAGPGMPPEVRERLFEPYYSTRFAGRGLGLSVVHGVLASHGGGIRVDSREGAGTTVTVLFPVRPEPAAPPAPAPHAPAGALPGEGTVLVVEDEEALRVVAAQALAQLGYQPLEAADGVEALRQFEAHRDDLRLVLMDLVMPNMDGDRAYRELRRAGAVVPIVLTSGFGAEEALRPFRGRGVAGFLPKPYHLQDLARALREAQDRPPAREPLAWDRALETGHPALDRQHRDLVEAYNQIVLAAAWGGPGEPERALARLIDATAAHFALEESLMQATGCPDLRRHQAGHAQLIAQARALAGRIQRGEAGFTAAVLDYLQDWVVCHIQTEDRGMARHLNQDGH